MKSRNIAERVKSELHAHAEDDVLAESYRLKNRFSHIWTYPSKIQYDQKFRDYLSDIKGKRILDYGCGRGQASLEYLKQGAHVYGIDISPPYIEECKNLAQSFVSDGGAFDFRVMDAHNLEFADDMFDIVAGNGILHHLDAQIALSEIHRVLKPGGRVILQEPLADNPLLKFFRFLTPKARTPDEMPFSQSDLDLLIDDVRWESESHFCGILEAPVAMFTSIIMPKSPQNVLLRVAHKLEKRLNEKGYCKAWNQYILFSLIKRNKHSAN
ncbi:MAG: class I SAM-dependent methyltransferase [Desulfobacterales bacterium]|nr:class I SAM-dependent methyltransferase [Desulfobacterales bacterium]